MMLLRRALSLLGIDRAVAMTLLGRCWSVLAGVLTVVVIGRFLSPEMQGYYFTFVSLIGLQVMLELGLGYALVQFASHEMAALSWDLDGRLHGDAGALRRLQSLLRFALTWLGIAGVFMVAVFIPLGAGFLADKGAGEAARHAVAAWRWLVPLAALNLLLSAALSLLEGCGRVAQVGAARLAQAVIGYALLWLGLMAGAGLLALAAQSLGMLLAGLAWLLLRQRPFFRSLLAARQQLPGIAWRREIWPFQWRIAVSWGSGYLIVQLFSPLLFATHGAVPAGQFGLSLQVCGALNLVGLAWISAQVPAYGRLMARGESDTLERLFLRGLLQSGAALLAMLAVLLAVLWALLASESPYAQRLLPWPQLLWLAVVTLANHVVYAQAALLRASRQEPFMLLSLCHGLATAALAFAWVPPHGLAGAVAAHCAATLLVSLPGGTAIFLRRRRAGWAAPAAVAAA